LFLLIWVLQSSVSLSSTSFPFLNMCPIHLNFLISYIISTCLFFFRTLG
jgi:hypothetical protein